MAILTENERETERASLRLGECRRATRAVLSHPPPPTTEMSRGTAHCRLLSIKNRGEASPRFRGMLIRCLPDYLHPCPSTPKGVGAAGDLRRTPPRAIGRNPRPQTRPTRPVRVHLDPISSEVSPGFRCQDVEKRSRCSSEAHRVAVLHGRQPHEDAPVIDFS